MPVLLMARGDQEARDLLKKAIQARYGLRPIAIDTLLLSFSGQVQMRIGPINTWVPLEANAAFDFPDAMRWDTVAKPMGGIAVQRWVECYDGQRLYMSRGRDKAQTSDSTMLVESAQRRLWAMAALMLMPLGEHFVTLKQDGERSLIATNTELGASAKICFDERYWIQSVSVDCYNGETNSVQTFTLQIDNELVSFEDVLLPKTIQAYWDDQLWYEVVTTAARVNLVLPPDTFKAKLGATSGL